MGKFEKENLPVISKEQLESLFADLILWYDKDYCKTKEGAYEVIGEYMTSDGRDEETSESILNKHIVINSEAAVCKYYDEEIDYCKSYRSFRPDCCACNFTN